MSPARAAKSLWSFQTIINNDVINGREKNMNTQMMICMVIFAATLVSYMMNKIPMWLTAMLSLTALYFTGCIDATGALAGFSNANTLLMATMFIVAAGFRRTSLVDGMCDAIMKLTRGSFLTAYFGYILIAVLLTNFIASPMVVYASTSVPAGSSL